LLLRAETDSCCVGILLLFACDALMVVCRLRRRQHGLTTRLLRGKATTKSNNQKQQ
jgi:hypothetical protein